MLHFTTSQTEQDLQGILDLQSANLPANLAPEEIEKEGFVTVRHRLEDLQKMNAVEQSVIAKDGDRVVGYLIAMTGAAKKDIPQLLPMFDRLNEIAYRGKKITGYHYLVVGQVCIAKGYRGQGVLDACYAAYRGRFKDKYDLAITEIATANVRSLKAHRRIGFEEVDRFTGPDGVEWSVVVWDWQKKEDIGN